MREIGEGEGFMEGFFKEGIFEMRNENVLVMYKVREIVSRVIVSVKGLGWRRKWFIGGIG